MLLGFIILAVAFLPNFVWLVFYLKEDPHPEPKPLLTLAFLFGILSVGVVFLLQKGSLLLFSELLDLSSRQILDSTAFILAAAFLEEIVKFIMARFLLQKNPYFDEPVDAMIYLVVVALGFAFTENLLYLRHYSNFYEVVNLAMLRFVSANLLHTVASGLAGYFWAKGIMQRRVWRNVFIGLLLAGVIHGSYNILAFYLKDLFILDIPIVFILITGLFMLGDFEKLKKEVEALNKEAERIIIENKRLLAFL